MSVDLSKSAELYTESTKKLLTSTEHFIPLRSWHAEES